MAGERPSPVWEAALRQRGVLSRAVNTLIADLEVGQERELMVPEVEPWRRKAIQIVNGRAAALWGVGNYRLVKLTKTSFAVVRTG